MKFIGPLIVVRDMKTSQEFYENLLGQKVQYDFGENVAFEDGLSLHLQPHFAVLLGIPEEAIRHKPRNAELYFETDDITSFAEKLKAARVETAHDLTEQPWGQRVVRFYDPDGHLIEAGESMESVVRRFLRQGMTAAEAASRTSMPLEFVESLGRAGGI